MEICGCAWISEHKQCRSHRRPILHGARDSFESSVFHLDQMLVLHLTSSIFGFRQKFACFCSSVHNHRMESSQEKYLFGRRHKILNLSTKPNDQLLLSLTSTHNAHRVVHKEPTPKRSVKMSRAVFHVRCGVDGWQEDGSQRWFSRATRWQHISLSVLTYVICFYAVWKILSCSHFLCRMMQNVCVFCPSDFGSFFL